MGGLTALKLLWLSASTLPNPTSRSPSFKPASSAGEVRKTWSMTAKGCLLLAVEEVGGWVVDSAAAPPTTSMAEEAVGSGGCRPSVRACGGMEEEEEEGEERKAPLALASWWSCWTRSSMRFMSAAWSVSMQARRPRFVRTSHTSMSARGKPFGCVYGWVGELGAARNGQITQSWYGFRGGILPTHPIHAPTFVVHEGDAAQAWRGLVVGARRGQKALDGLGLRLKVVAFLDELSTGKSVVGGCGVCGVVRLSVLWKAHGT